MPLDAKHALLDEALRQLWKVEERETMERWHSVSSFWRAYSEDAKVAHEGVHRFGLDPAATSGADVLRFVESSIMATWREQRETLKEKLHLYFTDDGKMHTFWCGYEHPLRKTYDDLRYLVHELDGFDYPEDSKLSEFEYTDWYYVDLLKNGGSNVGLKEIGKVLGMEIPKTHRDCDEKDCCYRHECPFAEYVKQLLKETKHPNPDLEEMWCGGDIDWTPELEVRLEAVLAALVLQAAEEQSEALLKVSSEGEGRKRARLED